MNLQEVILSVLEKTDNLRLEELATAVSKRKPTVPKDLIFEMIRRMRGKTIVRNWKAATNDFHFTIVQAAAEKPVAKMTIKASTKEVIARQVLNGARIEVAAEEFACRPLTVIRKVQEFCKNQNPELYNSLIRSERKTATIEDLRDAFTGY